MPGSRNRQWIIRELPQDKLSRETFEFKDSDIPQAKDGEVLTRSLYLSLDAANRASLQGRGYNPVEPGQVMRGLTIAEIVSSKDDQFKTGDLVTCYNGWQEYAVQPAKNVTPLGKRRGKISDHLNVYGTTSLTAYFGVLDVLNVQEQETFVVSAAAGAVGHIAGQIATLKGARAIGIVGSDEKCTRLQNELGFASAVNYKTGPVVKTLKETCPEGVDCYFDNVGGDTLEALLFRMKQYGRIACCGVVSQYDTGNPAPGPRGVPGLLVTKRLTMKGFYITDYFDRKEMAFDEIQNWVESGKIKPYTDIIDGLEHTPEGLVGLLAGNNFGKRVVRIAPDAD